MAGTISATNTELPKPVNVIFQQTLLRNAQARAPYFAGVVPGEIQANRGTATISWRRINTSLDHASGPAPSTTALTELTGDAAYFQGRSSITAHVSAVTATVSKFGQVYVLNEEANLFNFNGQMDKLVETLGILAGRSLNQLQRNNVEDNATKVFAGNVASEGAVLTAVAVGDLHQVINTLNRNSARTFTAMSVGSQSIGTQPILPAYWAICHPDVAHDVSGLTGFKSVETYAGQIATAPFEFGVFGRGGQALRFLQTEDASINSGSGGATTSLDIRGATNADTYTISIYGMDALGSVGLMNQQTTEPFMTNEGVLQLPVIQLIAKGFGEGGAADPFNEVSTLAYKFWHSSAILNANWSRALIVAATDLSN